MLLDSTLRVLHTLVGRTENLSPADSHNGYNRHNHHNPNNNHWAIPSNNYTVTHPYWGRKVIIMSKKRPGVDAAMQLLQCHHQSNNNTNKDIGSRWEAVFDSHQNVLGYLSSSLISLDLKAKTLGEELRSETNDNKESKGSNHKERTSISKKELLEIVIPWKFAVGKPRNALLGQLRSNTEQEVEHATTMGIALAKKIPSTPQLPQDEDMINDHVKKPLTPFRNFEVWDPPRPV